MVKKYMQIIIIALIVISQFVNQLIFPLPTILICTLILLAFIFIDKRLQLGLFCLLIPISTNVLLYFANIIFVFTLFIKYRNQLSLNSTILYILSIAIVESFHVISNINNGMAESIIILYGFILCLLPFGIINSINTYFNKIRTIELFFIGYMTFTIITFIKYYITFGTINIFNSVQRFGFVEDPKEISDNSIIINPNTLGIYSALIITTILVLIYFKIMNINLKNIFMFFFALFVGLITISRTFILILLLVLLVYTVISVYKKNVVAISGIGILSIVLILNLMFNSQLVNMIKKRIFETEDISGSRFSIYADYFNVIFSNENIFIWGVGMQDYLPKIEKFNNFITQATHNIVLEVLTIWGLVGFILVILLFASIIYSSKFWENSSFSDALVKLLPCMAIAISSQLGQFFISFYHTFPTLLLALIFLNVKVGAKNG